MLLTSRILRAQPRGHWSVAVAEGGSALFLRSLAPIMRSHRLDLKLVQALVVKERHSAMSSARASSSSVSVLSCLRWSLMESLNSFFGRPS